MPRTGANALSLISFSILHQEDEELMLSYNASAELNGLWISFGTVVVFLSCVGFSYLFLFFFKV